MGDKISDIRQCSTLKREDDGSDEPFIYRPNSGSKSYDDVNIMRYVCDEVDTEDNSSDDAELSEPLESLRGSEKRSNAWMVFHHSLLPQWLRDNEYIHHGHRPEMNSFSKCFESIFHIHTETGNIWTHLLGCIAFLSIAIFFLTRPAYEIQWQEKAVFTSFFLGAVVCLGFSTLFHTVMCHSFRVNKFFNKLDYCGIAILIVGSFVPALYYCFYCSFTARVTYIVLITALGVFCIVVAMWDKFSQPQFRAVRAGVFVALGLFGTIPTGHYAIVNGWEDALTNASLGWLIIMACSYISGAIIYAIRFPEKYFPGVFDIWLQSHQIFHTFVLAGAFIHYHGITEAASNRLTTGDCSILYVEKEW